MYFGNAIVFDGATFKREYRIFSILLLCSMCMHTHCVLGVASILMLALCFECLPLIACRAFTIVYGCIVFGLNARSSNASTIQACSFVVMIDLQHLFSPQHLRVRMHWLHLWRWWLSFSQSLLLVSVYHLRSCSFLVLASSAEIWFALGCNMSIKNDAQN